MNHIELFAGCGGMSLGFGAAGFDLLLANELSPMAAETFAYNILQTDLSNINEDHPTDRVHWLNSRFEMGQKRLRENPFEYPDTSPDFTQLSKNFEQTRGGLIVGNIIHLNRMLTESPEATELLRKAYGDGEVDLVSGGPPCQSFSLAGLREKNNDKNKLPWEFAKFVDTVRPRTVLLENVTGILRPFTENGKKYHAWFEVARAFARVGYVPICLHLNAKFCGVAQNRPRYIMLALRSDLLSNPRILSIEGLEPLIQPGWELYSRENAGEPILAESMRFFDAHKELDRALLAESFLSPLVSEGNYTSVGDAIGDLMFDDPTKASSYVLKLEKILGGNLPNTAQNSPNHDARTVSPRVQRRFRIYQIAQSCEPAVKKEIYQVLGGKSESLTDAANSKLMCQSYLTGEQLTETEFTNPEQLLSHLKEHATKKQTQRALDVSQPAPAALSIPDDACHWREPRTLTVREMARIQSFPDRFIFRSKVTTGGTNRRFEVPQYTQIGNAVPPLFAFALASSLAPVLEVFNGLGQDSVTTEPALMSRGK